MEKLKAIFNGSLCFIIGLTMFIVGCAPIISKTTRLEWSPYDQNEDKQEKDGIIVEMKNAKTFPPSFYVRAQACNENGALLVTQNGEAVMDDVCLVRPGQYWQQVAITNNTDHIIRLNQVVMRLFDPTGNQNEPVSKDDLSSSFIANRPCASSYQIVEKFKLIKMIDRNIEILPNSTVTGWVAFIPASMSVPGMWKLAVYEIPTKVDDTGKVTKTARFEFRNNLKKYMDTYEQKDMFKPKVLIDSKEVTD